MTRSIQAELPLTAGPSAGGCPTRDQIITTIGAQIDGRTFLYAHSVEAMAGRAGLTGESLARENKTAGAFVRLTGPRHREANTYYQRRHGTGTRVQVRRFSVARRWVMDSGPAGPVPGWRPDGPGGTSVAGSPAWLRRLWPMVPWTLASRARWRMETTLVLHDLAHVLYVCAWPWCDAFLGTEWGRFVVLDGASCPVTLDRLMAKGDPLALAAAEYHRVRMAPTLGPDERETLALRSAWHVWEAAAPMRRAADLAGQAASRLMRHWDRSLPLGLSFSLACSVDGETPAIPQAVDLVDALAAFEDVARL